MTLYYIDLPYACYGVVVENNKVINTGPIATWMLNKPWIYCYAWLLNKKATVLIADVYN